MMTIRRGADRGHFDHGWLDTFHTFSFADYHDPKHHQFRALRVINEDRVAPGGGFGMHPHRDMEILTFVLEGALEHQDSLGNRGVIRPGEVQHMTAGTGILHSEYNPSNSEAVHLYQIWLFPGQRGLKPGYEQKPFAAAGRQGKLQLIAAPGAEGDALPLHQDARVYLADLRDGDSVNHRLANDRHAWVQVLRGQATVQGEPLSAGDGAAISDEREVRLGGTGEVLVFDLA